MDRFYQVSGGKYRLGHVSTVCVRLGEVSSS
jgi:hypothetical protein